MHEDYSPLDIWKVLCYPYIKVANLHVSKQNMKIMHINMLLCCCQIKESQQPEHLHLHSLKQQQHSHTTQVGIGR